MAKISAYTEQTDPDNDDLFVMVRAGVNYKIKLATLLEYVPDAPSSWGSPEPASYAEALDTLINLVGGSLPADGSYTDIVVSSSGTVWSLAAAIDFTGKTISNGTLDNFVIEFSALTDCAITDANNVISVTDSLFHVVDGGDPTKRLEFQLSGVSAATTRTLTIPDASGTVALTTDILGQGTGLDVDAYGFRGIPQNAQTDNYTTVASDAGKHIAHASGAGAGDTYTIDGTLSYEIGTAITFVNMDSNALSIAISSDTMNLAGAGTAGTRSLAQYGIATAVKVASTVWLISGTGLT